MFYVPTRSAECWKSLLADPEKQWRAGFSARTLASCWEHAKGVPPEISCLFPGKLSLLFAVPEHRVDLPGGRRASQTDLFALMRWNEETVACAIEGKVEEPFGPTLGEWLAVPTPGKQERLAYLCRVLGLTTDLPMSTRYQLIHRTASAVIEADRFKTDHAAIIVHSFSDGNSWFSDFAAFQTLFRQRGEIGQRVSTVVPSGRPLHLAWAQGDMAFLKA
jgi:hypothetical protein